MIYNSSSFRIGQKYYFNIQEGDSNLEDVECVVVAKGNRKMQLQMGDKTEWYSNNNLTSSRTVHRPKISPTTAKIITKPVVVEVKKPISITEIRDKLVKDTAQNYEKCFPQGCTPTLSVDKFNWSTLNGECVDDAFRYAFVAVKRSLREMLIAKGYGKVAELTPKTSTKTLFSLMKNYLPQYSEAK